MARTQLLRTRDLDERTVRRIRALLDAAFTDFADTDWDHALGGWHVLAVADHRTDASYGPDGADRPDGADGDGGSDGEVLAHAAVVARQLEFGGTPHTAGYVEAVATAPHAQGRGLGSQVMTELGRVLRREFEVGVLSTDRHAFYERLGWERWTGPTSVRQVDGRIARTPEEDAGIMVLRFGRSRQLLPTTPILCEARPGDDW